MRSSCGTGETDLSGFDGVILPGGFAHGDYLRTGAIARFSPVMSDREAPWPTPAAPVRRHLQRIPDPLRGGSATLVRSSPTATSRFICRPWSRLEVAD